MSVYSKARYTPIAGTTPVGYTLLWSTTHSPSLENAGSTNLVHTTFTFNFNSNVDGKLLIEMVERVTAARTSATTSNAISCQIPL
ncbi:MAG: hypothetical protein Q4B17_05950 [Lautropia sp.]|nr:hypothetical protein [Lautropia sp.]